jgi:hypothetical protein
VEVVEEIGSVVVEVADLDQADHSVQEKCTKPYVLSVRKNVKYRLSPQKESLFFVEIVTQNVKLHKNI